MQWNDIRAIAAMLEEYYPDADNINLRSADFHHWITNLPGFRDDPNKSSEHILEAIQAAWIEERNS